MNDDPLLSRREAATFLGVAVGTLENWAWNKRYDLPITKIGTRMCKYRLSDLKHFLESGVKSTEARSKKGAKVAP